MTIRLLRLNYFAITRMYLWWKNKRKQQLNLYWTVVVVANCFKGGGMFEWQELVGSEVNTTTSGQLPPKVTSIVRCTYVKWPTLEYRYMRTNELVRAWTATHKHPQILTRTFRPSAIMVWSLRPKGAIGQSNLPQSTMFTPRTGWECQGLDSW